MTTSDDLNKRKAGLSEAKRALLLKRLQGKRANEPTGGITRQPQDGPLTLSYTQQRVWFLQQLFPNNRAYNMSEAWRLLGTLDTAAMQHALQEVVRRHASLRTHFVAPDNLPMQQVATEVSLSLNMTDISHLSPAEREETLLQMVLAEGNHAFDLSRAPLLRASLIRLDSDDHVLQLVLHHIITDEWSNDIIWRELAASYTAALAESTDEVFPQDTIQYSDYARWQRNQVESGALDQQMRYWQDQLSGALQLLQLPADRPRAAQQSLRGGIVRHTLPAELLQGLKTISQEAGTTLYPTLLAAFQTLLYRYSGQEDVLVGTPIANRQRAETADVIGMFINTAVMRANVSADMTFRQLLDQVQQTVIDALANQDLPFDLLVQALHPERDLSYNPLFQTMFVFRSDNVERTLTGLNFEPIKVDRGVSKFDLTLFAGEEDGRLMSALEFSADLFDRATAARMLDHWQVLLESIVADPETPVGLLPLLSGNERELVLNTWNNTDAPLPETRCLHELISAQAVHTPEAAAVISGEERLAYRELEDRANQLAHTLTRHGITPGTPVGLFSERAADMVVGILGILKASGAYVPLEPAYPAERIAFSLADTGAPVIVAQAHLVDDLPPTNAAVVIIDDAADITDEPEGAPETAVSLNDLAYIIYTSGSTGTPKGVMVTHGNLLASTMARKETYEKPVGRYLLLSSFAFDSSVAGIFWTLASGGTLVLPAPDDEKDVQKLARLIASEQVTHTLALPTLYRLLLTYAPPGSLDSLQLVIVAGEACPDDMGEKHYAMLPESALYNEYGPTEATVWCSVYRLPKDSDGGSVPIGHPISNSQLYILDNRLQPVPIGVPGELYVGGAGVTPGYWQKPDLTAQRFPTVDLLAQKKSGRVYRTGDLARWRADGQIEFLGRVDDQVKLRGFRIELGEIEALLLRHPDVTEAVVTVWEQPGATVNADKRLVAYVTGEQVDDGAKLRAYLSRLLPEYMVPRQVIYLPAMPHTPNGKINRSRLPQPNFERDGQRPYIAPRSAAEETLARIWRDILRLPQVSVEDKFFELGGDSIMSIQVIARARQEGLVLTPRQLFQEQTIARLADAAAEVEQIPAAPTETTGIVPLTSIQQWFFTQQLSNPAHWNQAAWFETDADLNLEALQQALGKLVELHPMLRARFRQADSHWQQEVVDRAPPTKIEQFALSGLAPAAQETALLSNANELHAGLNLTDGPLLRAAWFDLGPDRQPRLLLTIHHLVVDAVSWGILVPDLLAAYTQIAAGKPAVLPPASTSYAQWAETQARLARSEAMQREAAYWREIDQQAIPLPRDGLGHDYNTEGKADLVEVSLDSARTEQLLREVHGAYHTRIDDLLLAALMRAAGVWRGKRTLLLTVERHGREEIDPRLDISRTVGWFTSLFPLTLTLPDEGDEGATIRAVKEQLRAIPQNGVGYGMLRYLGDDEIRQQLAAQPQPEILFNYLGVARHDERESVPIQPIAANIGQLYGPQNERVHLIDVNARVTAGRLTARWQFAPAYFQKSTIETVAGTFTEELAKIIDHCMEIEQGQHTPSDFPLANLQQDDLDSLSDLLADLE